MGFLPSPILEPCLLTPTRKAARSLRKKTFRIPKIFKRIFSETNSPGSINPDPNCGRTFGFG